MIRVTLALGVVRALELFCRARTSELDAGVASRRQNVGFTIRVCWGRRKGAVMISARVHYACLAMLELASHPSGDTPVSLREISDRHGVPGPFLVQIFRSLRTAGWVQSVRGSQGGYRLLIRPSELSLLEIAEVVGYQESGNPGTGKSTAAELMLQEIWDEMSQASRNVLAGIQLSDLAQRHRNGEESMFYI